MSPSMTTSGGRARSGRSSKEPLAQRSARRRWWIVLACVGVGAWALLFVAGDGGWLDLRREQQRLQALQDEVARLEAQNDSLRTVLQRMEADPAFLEKVARENLGMVRPGERLYRIQSATDATDE